MKIQKYRHEVGNKEQWEHYSSRKCTVSMDEEIILLNREGMGTSSIGQKLSIPKASVQSRLERCAALDPASVHKDIDQVYEVGVLYTFIGDKTKPCYVIYARNRKAKQMIDFVCGARNTDDIEKIIKTLLALKPKRVYTDKLNIFCQCDTDNDAEDY